ncbi:MAG TPA: nucleotidyltransferase domain-containing protein [Gallionellaceae bacterium]
MDKSKPAILSAHPIAPEVRARIIQALDEIEAQHQVKVLFACESGSRGWGFASPDSDYDVRFIYVHKLPWYLTVHAPRDVVELPISDELDVNGWELRKALQLLRKSNPTLLEWLDSPVVYRADAAFAARMQGFVPEFFSSQGVRHHYLSMARKNFRSYLQGETVRLKKYLYVLRPLLAARWIDSGRGMPPMRFAELAEATVESTALAEEINRLLAIKMGAGEAEYSPRWNAIHAFIESELARSERDPAPGRPAGNTASLDRFLAETVQAFD